MTSAAPPTTTATGKSDTYDTEMPVVAVTRPVRKCTRTGSPGHAEPSSELQRLRSRLEGGPMTIYFNSTLYLK